MPVTTAHPFNIWIMPETLVRLNEYARAALPNEIGGLAKLRFEDDNVFIVDLAMLPQKATAGTFNIDKDDVHAWTLDMVKQGRADELPDWCSIVHSHPVGMDPGMSSVDVAAIKSMAEEQDFFSLIISASHQADSTNLAMHYCGNVRGGKVLIADIPVRVAWSMERMKAADSAVESVLKDIGLDLTDKQLADFRTAIRKQACESLPTMSDEAREKLRSDIEAEVEKIMPKPKYKPGRAMERRSSADEWAGLTGYVHGGAAPRRGTTWGTASRSIPEHERLYNAWVAAEAKVSDAELKGADNVDILLVDALNAQMEMTAALRDRFGMAPGDLVRIKPVGGYLVGAGMGWGDTEDTGIIEGYVGGEQWDCFEVNGQNYWPEELVLMRCWEAQDDEEVDEKQTA